MVLQCLTRTHLIICIQKRLIDELTKQISRLYLNLNKISSFTFLMVLSLILVDSFNPTKILLKDSTNQNEGLTCSTIPHHSPHPSDVQISATWSVQTVHALTSLTTLPPRSTQRTQTFNFFPPRSPFK